MEIEKLDDSNIKIKAQVSAEELEKRVDQIAKRNAKGMKIDGFRKGKVPASVVKRLYKKELEDEAEGEILREVLKNAKEEADIKETLGEPIFENYKRDENGLEVEIIISVKPEINIEGYKDLVPSFDVPEVSEKEIEDELENIAKSKATAKDIEKSRELQNGDIAVIDFIGFIDGEAFEGGSAEGYELEIGSKSFVGDFEEQLIGMKKGETKEITVKFPDDYQAENLKGKETKFEVTLKGIKEKVIPAVDDELAKAVIGKDDVTLDDLKEFVKKELLRKKLNELYEERLKNEMLETFVEKFDFAVPKNILEQEIDNLANQKAQSLSKEELEEVQGNKEKIDELRESVREDAINSVKATFIVDAIAKAENVNVDDNELYQVIYYESLMSGQDPQQVISYYEKNNLMPALKMGMIEDKLFSTLLGFEKILEPKKEEETKQESK